MADQQQPRDGSGRELTVGQLVILRDCEAEFGWPVRASPYIGKRLLILGISSTYNAHWDDWVVTVGQAVNPNHESFSIKLWAQWLQAADVGLRGLINRYQTERMTDYLLFLKSNNRNIVQQLLDGA